ncbi:MAG: AraC family transcriptional regulator [Spirosomataceae bacterium]
MKTVLKKSVESVVGSFTVRELIEPHFDPSWHFHPHYQLFTVLEGTGTRFIADDIRHFEPRDTVFMGPNIPHLWRSDKAYFENNSVLRTHGIVVYFTEDFVGKGFFDKPEMYLLHQLLQNSHRGLDVVGTFRPYLQQAMRDLCQLSGFDRVIKLLGILHQLSQSTEVAYIASMGYTNTYKVSETERMQKVHEYVLKHFKEEIRLSELASLVSMSEAAFCRYFKNRTNKTFFAFVAEIRIGHACKLLLDKKLSVTQAAYESGYNTLSNFNRQFLSITGKTPLQYQKDHWSN